LQKEKELLQDRYGRTIDTVRVSVTDKCNLHCTYCRPDENKMYYDTKEKILALEEIADIVKEMAAQGVKRVKLTGGEPLLRKGIDDLVKMIADIAGIEDFSMTTNGILLKKHAKTLKENGLNRVNISLDTLDKDKYYKITKGNLDDVLEGIQAAKDVGLLPIKINTVFLYGINDNDIISLKDFCKEHNLKHQLINQMDLTREKELFDSLEIADKPPKCGKCTKIRMTNDGKILPCLFSDLEVDVKEFDNVSEALIKATLIKPKSGYKVKNRVMTEIGG